MIEKLIQAFTTLPGVGSKTAQRFAYHLLQHHRQNGLELSEALQTAMQNVQKCKRCQNLSEREICHICDNPKRDASLLCVVESPTDVIAIEQTNTYQGKYFVLTGYLSPIDGIGAKELGLDNLIQLLKSQQIQEMILATNSTVEGEVTAHYLKKSAESYSIKTTRLAHGIPLGGELEYTDSYTLAHAFQGRSRYE